MSASFSPNENNRKGIHIEDALSILSARSKAGRENGEHMTTIMKNQQMPKGQTIDLFQSSQTSLKGNQVKVSENENYTNENWTQWTQLHRDCEHACYNDNNGENSNGMSNEIKEQKIELERIRKQRDEKIRSKLKLLSIKELLQAILEVQKERVLTYKEFDEGLQTVLETGNISTYPKSCANATASFSVQSSTINIMNDLILHKRSLSKNYDDKIDIQKKLFKQVQQTHNLVRQLQTHESEKLKNTAALHLELIRKKDREYGNENKGNTLVEEPDQILKLLDEGIASLKKKLVELIQKINDILDELKCDLLDYED